MNAMTENVTSASQPMDNKVGAAELETSIAATAIPPNEFINEVTIQSASASASASGPEAALLESMISE